MDLKSAARRVTAGRRVPWRYLGIWMALALLIVLCLLTKPEALNAISRKAILPLASFVTIVSMGQALVIRMRGIDLSVPGVMAVSSLMVRSVGGGREGSGSQLLWAIVVALLLGALIGFASGVLVAVGRLSPLIVTLSMGAISYGFAVWYESGHDLKTSVPQSLADFGTWSTMGLNSSVFVTIVLVTLCAVLLKWTSPGRRYTAIGTNPTAARIAGTPVLRHQIVGYTAAALLYAVAGVLLAGFLGTPTLGLGDSYLLTPIVAVVLAGGALSGGSGSMVSIAGAALFLSLLRHYLDSLGLPTSASTVLGGVFVIVGMGFANVEAGAPISDLVRRRWRARRAATVVGIGSS